MAQLFANNLTTLLSENITSTDTNFLVQDGSIFPTPGVGEYFFITLVEFNNDGKEINWEIMKVTSVVGNSFTVVRGQDGTTAKAWSATTIVQHRLVAEALNDLETHAHNTSNPHGVTKASVGLGNVDNTSDANKPVSTAVGTALGLKANSNDVRFTDARDWTASTVSQAEAEAGTVTTTRKWTAQRVRQSTVAWWNGITAATLRTKAGLGTAATTASTAYATAAQGSTIDTLNAQVKVVAGNRVAIGGATASQKLQVYGNIEATDLLASSDIRLKETIFPLEDENCLETVDRLQPVSFVWKDSQKLDTGFIAQEVQCILPERVSGEDSLSLEYGKLTVHLVGAVKALKKEISELRNELNQLKDSQ